MKYPKAAHSYEVVSDLPKPLETLKRLAHNFRWTWHQPTRDLFRSIDKELWDSTNHNPVGVLSALSSDALERLAKDRAFLASLKACGEDLDEYLAAETWFDRQYPGKRDEALIAYFCAEFGVSEGLPIYSGGLGVLAGDHLKAASDLGLPLVGVGLLYSRGYFQQYLTPDGWQQEHYPQYDFYKMPLSLVRGEDQQPIRVQIQFPDRAVTCQVWRAEVGRVSLFLLDSNVLENAPTDQGITDTLYGGDEEMRIRQEMILGIGGMRALAELGMSPTVCHMNEGHAAFMAVERMRQFVDKRACDARVARQALVGGNVFTTHTPVPAGFDLFPATLVERYLAGIVTSVQLPFADFIKMGRLGHDNASEPFNMAVLAMANSNHVNGVSKLHATVSRSMFQQRWPGFPEDEVPIRAVTNGIHTPTWVSARMATLFDSYLSGDWRREASNPEIWQGVYNIPDNELWEARENLRGEFVRFVRRRLHRDFARRRAGQADYGLISTILDPRILTIGFARRFATYKRATLLLSDRERLKSLLFHSERPLQIVIAGKSHPRDDGGKTLIQELHRFITHEGGRSRMVFLEDYDMGVARAMVQGVDVWLNNPIRPMEASGTSGMKVVPNGGLNCSVLDGWWDEGYEPGLGWAIGDREVPLDPSQVDPNDARSLYQILEQEVAPKFYHRVDGGVPTAWCEMMKRSIAELAPQFSTARMVQDYARSAYMPAHETFTAMTSGKLDHAKAALHWRDRVRGGWSKVKIVKVSDSAKRINSLGDSFVVTAGIELGTMSPDEVRVEVIVGQVGPNRDLIDAKEVQLELKGRDDWLHTFEGTVTMQRAGLRGYIVRVVPTHPDVDVLHELPLVRWEEGGTRA
ncbi:MAG: alpha-glucan family phosphorylase [Fimbriimonadaceae bacterium]|nr:alpha-glucan family phosphorylase [Fimbriimonadaceae bacterium]